MTRYPLNRRLGGPQGPVRWTAKNLGHPPPPGFSFVFSCTLYFIRTCFLVLIIPHFAFTYNTNTNPPGGIRTRNPTMQSAPDHRLRPLGHWNRQIRTRNPSMRKDTELYTTPRGHRDWLGFDPRTIQPVMSRYTD